MHLTKRTTALGVGVWTTSVLSTLTLPLGPENTPQAEIDTSPPAHEQEAKSESNQHVVATGETLWRISKDNLDDPMRWTEIGFHNELPNPNLLTVGQVLDIPTETIEVPAGYGASAEPTRVETEKASTPARARLKSPSTKAPASTAKSNQGGGTGGHLASIRQCESGGRYDAVNPTGKYRGAYQFDRETWAGVGGTGDPAAASPAEQDQRAQMLYDQRGASPWPKCGR